MKLKEFFVRIGSITNLATRLISLRAASMSRLNIKALIHQPLKRSPMSNSKSSYFRKNCSVLLEKRTDNTLVHSALGDEIVDKMLNVIHSIIKYDNFQAVIIADVVGKAC